MVNVRSSRINGPSTRNVREEHVIRNYLKEYPNQSIGPGMVYARTVVALVSIILQGNARGENAQSSKSGD